MSVVSQIIYYGRLALRVKDAASAAIYYYHLYKLLRSTPIPSYARRFGVGVLQYLTDITYPTKSRDDFELTGNFNDDFVEVEYVD